MPEFLPLKIVTPSVADHFRPVRQRGGSAKEFVPVTSDLRQKLASQVSSALEALLPSIKTHDVPAVAKVRLRPQAIAKSHRPVSLLSNKTCPIIGSERSGDLIVSATGTGLLALRRQILENETKVAKANISTIESIEPYLPILQDNLFERATSLGRPPLKLRLHHHNRPTQDDKVYREAIAIVEAHGGYSCEVLPYPGSAKVMRLADYDEALIDSLAGYVGIKTLSLFPDFIPVRTTSIPLKRISTDLFPPPESDREYSVVGVVDSGTNPLDPLLTPWICGRLSRVPREYQNTTHGSFVAGLISSARRLNHGDPIFPASQAKILDVVVLSKDGASEFDVMEGLREAVILHPEVRVWNLSLGSGQTVSDEQFSDFGAFLDELQDEYDVLFVVAAGNVHPDHLRSWPPTAETESDRICSPADSARSIVVGSISHKSHPSTLAQPEEPSPFSRRGPGPNWLVKHDLVHYGGNCNQHGDCSQVGILSVNGNGQLAEDIGTSFSAPLVSVIAANLDATLVERPSLNLLKGLMVHSAAKASGRLSPETLPFYGYGKPGDVDEIIRCEPWESTLVFEVEVSPDLHLHKLDFPIPSCLRDQNGEFVGEILMTVVYDPPLCKEHGGEYCRVNIDASLGTYVRSSDGRILNFRGHVPAEPHQMSKMYERELVKFGFKWSPTKVFRTKPKSKIVGDNWRLVISANYRSGAHFEFPQRATILITISDPTMSEEVYNEVAQCVRQIGWITSDMQVRARLRQ